MSDNEEKEEKKTNLNFNLPRSAGLITESSISPSLDKVTMACRTHDIEAPRQRLLLRRC